ncbi:MAG: bifunctional indole-3-glycerol phosphate synthase/phosphoribosylanthranilate isomerase [Prevotella sp.]|nr:bifunctional indole-3-glycerol phosphate synthase/phosphoribosylanthranilate isomerase [Prevotella sp.]
MTDILNEITAHKRAEVECFKKILTEKDIHRQVEDMILGETVPTASMSKAIMEGSGIISTAIDYRLDILQLHGNESPAIIRELRSSVARQVRQDIKIMKAISIGNADDMQTFRRYEDSVDLFLFDTRCETSGGSGRQFDWTIINAYDGNRPFLLSGGIGPDDASRVMQVHHPMMLGIDINSKFETAPARKDAEAVRRFIGKLADLQKKADETNIQNQTQVIL